MIANNNMCEFDANGIYPWGLKKKNVLSFQFLIRKLFEQRIFAKYIQNHYTKTK